MSKNSGVRPRSGAQTGSIEFGLIRPKNVLDIVDRASGQITDEVAFRGRPNNVAVTKDGGRVLGPSRAGRAGST
jgi:hypothetical protein